MLKREIPAPLFSNFWKFILGYITVVFATSLDVGASKMVHKTHILFIIQQMIIHQVVSEHRVSQILLFDSPL